MTHKNILTTQKHHQKGHHDHIEKDNTARFKTKCFESHLRSLSPKKDFDFQNSAHKGLNLKTFNKWPMGHMDHLRNSCNQ